MTSDKSTKDEITEKNKSSKITLIPLDTSLENSTLEKIVEVLKTTFSYKDAIIMPLATNRPVYY